MWSENLSLWLFCVFAAFILWSDQVDHLIPGALWLVFSWMIPQGFSRYRKSCQLQMVKCLILLLVSEGVCCVFIVNFVFLCQAEIFRGQLPKTDNPTYHGEKLHQVFDNTRSSLDQLLAGYCLPDPFFRERLERDVETLMKCLRDPALPLFKFQVCSSFLVFNWHKKTNQLSFTFCELKRCCCWSQFCSACSFSCKMIVLSCAFMCWYFEGAYFYNLWTGSRWGWSGNSKTNGNLFWQHHVNSLSVSESTGKRFASEAELNSKFELYHWSLITMMRTIGMIYIDVQFFNVLIFRFRNNCVSLLVAFIVEGL